MPNFLCSFATGLRPDVLFLPQYGNPPLLRIAFSNQLYFAHILVKAGADVKHRRSVRILAMLPRLNCDVIVCIAFFLFTWAMLHLYQNAYIWAQSKCSYMKIFPGKLACILCAQQISVASLSKATVQLNAGVQDVMRSTSRTVLHYVGWQRWEWHVYEHMQWLQPCSWF